MINKNDTASTYHIGFQSGNGYVSIPISSGSITLVAGPNGVGKSALLAELYRSLPQGIATYLPGHRQINFNNGWETIGQDATQLLTNMFQHVDAFNRYKGAWAEDQFKTTIRRLLHAESAYNRDFRRMFSEGAYSERSSGSIRLSPLDTLNLVFEGARLPVTFELTMNGLSARREGAVYQIDAMSDGERAALFIVAAVVTQDDHTVVLIDEPEKHLHPSITAGLLEACIRSRPDLSLVVSSHDVFLIERLSPTNVIHVRNSQVTSIRPERRIFDAQIVADISRVPEDLRTSLLGSRSQTLFVEGEGGSTDVALYSHVYDGFKVVPRGSHSKVKEAVLAFTAMTDEHWLSPFGIIDGDGQSDKERAALSVKNIFPLPCPSIENVFFFEEMIACYVESSSNYSGGPNLDERLKALSEICLSISDQNREEISALRTSWILERRLSESKLSPADIKSGSMPLITLDVSILHSQVKADIDDVLSDRRWQSVMQNLPIKRTSLPNAAARALGASSFREYCSVILRQLDIRSEAGKEALSRLKRSLPTLSTDSVASVHG